MGLPTQTVGRRVLAAVERRGWTLGMLAAKSGVSKSQLSLLTRDLIDAPRLDTLVKIAEALRIDLSELTGATPPVPRAETISRGVTRVPIVRYAAHASTGAAPEETGDSVFVDELESRGRKLLAARVTGSCLWPDIEPGEIVVWDASQLRAQDGEAVAVTADGQLMVKRVYHEPDGTSILVANDGASVRADIVVILGVVVKVVKERRLERRPRPPGS